MAGGEGGNSEADVHHQILGRFIEIAESGTNELTELKCSREYRMIKDLKLSLTLLWQP